MTTTPGEISQVKQRTLLGSLVTDVADQDNHKLSSLLLRAKVFARRLGSEGFIRWVSNELDGYSSREATPDYRIIYPAVLGDCSGLTGRTENVPVALHRCPDNMRKDISEFPILDNCAAIEAMLASSSETHHRHFPPNAVNLVQQCVGQLVIGQQLVSLQAMFTDTQVAGVLFAIRNRLLEFLLSLQDDYPDLTGDESPHDAEIQASIDRLADRVLGISGVVVHTSSLEINMRDTYHTGQAGAVGPGSNASNISFQQVWDQTPVDLKAIAVELQQVANELREAAKTPEDQETIGTVLAAKSAAEQGDGPKVTAYLSKILPTIFDTCGKLSIGVGIRAIAKGLGF